MNRMLRSLSSKSSSLGVIQPIPRWRSLMKTSAETFTELISMSGACYTKDRAPPREMFDRARRCCLHQQSAAVILHGFGAEETRLLPQHPPLRWVTTSRLHRVVVAKQSGGACRRSGLRQGRDGRVSFRDEGQRVLLEPVTGGRVAIAGAITRSRRLDPEECTQSRLSVGDHRIRAASGTRGIASARLCTLSVAGDTDDEVLSPEHPTERGRVLQLC